MAAEPEEVAGTIRSLLLTTWSGRLAPEALRDDALLGEDGLGLDSVEIVEVLLALEDRYGVAVTESLIAGEPLTLRRVAEHFAGT